MIRKVLSNVGRESVDADGGTSFAQAICRERELDRRDALRNQYQRTENQLVRANDASYHRALERLTKRWFSGREPALQERSEDRRKRREWNCGVTHFISGIKASNSP